jgi:hypothetical protein
MHAREVSYCRGDEATAGLPDQLTQLVQMVLDNL